jgi:lycopene cyclase domain-containing protein
VNFGRSGARLGVAHFHYLLVLAFIGACAVGVNTGFRLGFSKKIKQFLLMDALIVLIYLAWDIWAVIKKSWYFDSNQIIGINLFSRLPIEEILFFVIVPLMGVLTYLARLKITGWNSPGKNSDDLF